MMAPTGGGKSRLLRFRIFQDMHRHIPTIVLDPTGGAISQFMDKVYRRSYGEQAQLWPRVRYVDMSGEDDYIIPFPLLVRQSEKESLVHVGERYADMVLRLDPQLAEAPMRGANAFRDMARWTGICLAGLGYQLTEAIELLRNPQAFKTKLEMLANRDKSYAVQEAVRFFINESEYQKWSEYKKDDRLTSFITKLHDIVLDDGARAVYSGPQILDWNDVIQRQLCVLFDFSKCTDSLQRFAMLSVLVSFMDFISRRGVKGRNQPISLIIDELSVMASESDIFVKDINRLINVIGRNFGVWLTLTHQSEYQLDERINKSLFDAITTHYIGATSDPETALHLAKTFHMYDETLIRKIENVYAGYSKGEGHGFMGVSESHSEGHPEKIDERTTEYSIPEQLEKVSEQFRKLQPLHFAAKIARHEGDRNGSIFKMSIANMDSDQWPDYDLIEKCKVSLTKVLGVPKSRVLEHIQSRQERLLVSDTIDYGASRKNIPKKSIDKEQGSEQQSNFTDIDYEEPT